MPAPVPSLTLTISTHLPAVLFKKLVMYKFESQTVGDVVVLSIINTIFINVDTANRVSESLARDSGPGVFPRFRDPL